MPLETYLAPWLGREIWLEAAPDAHTVTVTPNGATVTPLPLFCVPEDSFQDASLFCRYQIQLEPDRAVFHVERSGSQLKALLQKAQTLGVSTFVGLYQLLHE